MVVTIDQAGDTATIRVAQIVIERALCAGPGESPAAFRQRMARVVTCLAAHTDGVIGPGADGLCENSVNESNTSR
jgi:hypothetical protein